MNPILIFADGACLGNPGPGAAASIVANDKRALELGSFESNSTNNRMEILAAVQALEALDGWEGREVRIHTDSQYLINGIQKWIKGWKRNGWKSAEGADIKNKDLWIRLSTIVEKRAHLFKIDWIHVAGHRGIPGNERCDEIANTLASGSEIFLYDGSRREYSTNLEKLTPSKVAPKKSKTKTTASTYYVSLVGGTVHRDKSWKECEARVKGVRAAKYKKCSTADEENEILKAWGVQTSS